MNIENPNPNTNEDMGAMVALEDLKDVQAFGGDGKDTWMTGFDEKGEKKFIKTYDLKGPDSEYLANCLKREAYCYKNIDLPVLPKMSGVNEKEGYLILDYIEDLSSLEPANDDMDKLVDISLNGFGSIDPAFLPKREDLAPVFDKIRGLREEGHKFHQEALGLIEKSEAEIENNAKHFVHGDYILQNFKKNDKGEIFVFDYELSSHGHLFSDLATLYVDLAFAREKQKYLFKKVSEHPEFKEDIFKALVLRRAIGQVYALRKNAPETRPMKTGLEVLASFGK